MSVAPLLWGEVIKWANQFYSSEYVVYVPKTSVKTTTKLIRGKEKSEVETIVEETPIVLKRCILEDYELEIIMQLSREYCDEYHSATDPSRPCPKEIFLDEVDNMAEADAMLAGFKALLGGNAELTKIEVIPK